MQGLADTFALLGYSFESEEAQSLNKEMFAAIYHGAMRASVELAKKDGPYDSFKGSPLSEGKFQFDLWKEEPCGDWNWEALRKKL